MRGGDATAEVFVLQRGGAARRAAAAALRPALVPDLPVHLPRRQQPAQGRLALRQGRHAAHPARGRQGDGGGAAAGGVRRAHRAPHRLLPRPLALPRHRRLPARRTSCSASCKAIVEADGERRERPEVLGRAPEDAPGLHASWWRRWRCWPRPRCPGVTTKELDRIARERIEKAGAKPAFLGYRGYPATLCISVNEEVVHGIPGDRKLKDGDIVGLDLGCVVDGFYGDAARTVARGPRQRRRRARLMRGDRGGPARGHRAVPPRQARGRHRPRRAEPRRGARLLGGARVRGPRHRDQPARGAAGAELRAAGPARAAGAGHVPGHRAHGERRAARGAGAGRRLDGGHRGRQPVRPLRAVGGGDRAGPLDPVRALPLRPGDGRPMPEGGGPEAPPAAGGPGPGGGVPAERALPGGAARRRRGPQVTAHVAGAVEPAADPARGGGGGGADALRRDPGPHRAAGADETGTVPW